VLLIIGNAALLAALGYALYHVATHPPVIQPPMPTPISLPAACPTLALPVGATPTPFGSGGAIAFTLWRDGNADIYALNEAEREPIRLTFDSAIDRQPTWSPDGKYLAFASNRAHNWDIYLLDLASGALIRLTHDPGFDSNPAWSPDGQWIAFEGYRNGNLDLYVMDVLGQEVRRITYDPAPDFAPAWSPDGSALAFASFRNGNKDVFVVRLRGDRKTINVTQSPGIDEDEPAWSSDGAQLAFVSGPRSGASVQVAPFTWETESIEQAEAELFGAGTSPAWAPDQESVLYVVERSGRSHLVAASISGWALFHEVATIEGAVSDLAWSAQPLTARTIARAQAEAEPDRPPPYVELLQPTPESGPPYRLVTVPVLSSEGTSRLSDRVNESFNALRQRVIQEAGWDYLGRLGSTARPITYTPPTGQSRMSWHLCGRAIELDQKPYEGEDPQIELVREDAGNVTYWRVFLRASRQDGSMGEPLREAPWDLHARDEGAAGLVEGGAYKETIPAGYYVDLTALASEYGWERVPALWRWRYFWPDIRWWELQKTDGLSWWACMLEIHSPKRIESAFGPIPGYED
jgi:TolB protein